MILRLKNKHTLIYDEFIFKCCIGKKGLTSLKIEGDNKTPKGTYKIQHLYFRKDRIKKPETKLKCIEIKNTMGWCNDARYPRVYNKLISNNKTIKHEKLKRKDYKYDLLIPIKYNFIKPKINKGSCIFLHLTKDYKPTAGCIALNKKDFLILARLIEPNTMIKII